VRGGLLGLVLLCVSAFGARSAPAGDAPQDLAAAPLAESRAHLEAGEYGPAFERALLALEYDPTRLELLDHASLCAEKAGRGDEALLYAWLGLAEGRAEELEAVELERRTKRVASLDPLPTADRPDLDGHGRRLLAIAVSCIDRKLFANAVEFLFRCKGTASGPEADAVLGKLYESDRSLQALLDTGIDVPVRDASSAKALRMARRDGEHEAWEDAWKIKGRNYTIVTNVGWQFANDVSMALEQLHPYYCSVFLGKRGASKTSRCVVDIYRDQQQFLDNEAGVDEGTLGFFQPGENRIATYDPRCEGAGLGQLWETLFHEAAHQFMEIVTTGLVPAWINEGTAAYFEGAYLQPTGHVVANTIPRHYLIDVKAALDENFPTLRDVVSYFEPGSYDACYYPVGWGLVYFLLNYEDESCERVYVPLYESYLKTYKRGGKHDSMERFEEYFVKKARQGDVKDFGTFKVRLKTWIDELHRLELGGGEVVDTLLERARREVKKRRWDAALETYRWALRKSPAHRACLFELAELLRERKERDPAIFYYRRLLEVLGEAATSQEGAGEMATTARARLTELDPTMAQLQEVAEGALRERVLAAASLYVEKGFPRTAIMCLEAAIRLLGRAPKLTERLREIVKATKEDVWRWRRVPAERGLAPWFCSGDWKARDAALAIETRYRGTLLLRDDLPARYRIEATVKIEDMRTKPFVGLLFGVGDSGILNVWGTRPGGTLEAIRIVEDLVTRNKLGELRSEWGAPFRLAVEVDGGWARFFVDGSFVGEHYYDPKDISGRPGLMVEGSSATFTDVRVGI